MALEVTENWSAQRLSMAWPWNAYREFVVTGTEDPKVSLLAIDPATGVRIPQENEGHVFNPDRLLCSGPYVKEVLGPSHFIVGVNYACPPSGEFGGQGNTDPLQMKPQISWNRIVTSEPVDIDIDGRPILNSAGDPFTALATREFHYKGFRVVKNFPYFDLLLSRDYEGSVNKDRVTLSSVVSVAAEHMRCVLIQPVASYTPDAKFIPVAFDFEIVPEGLLGKHPFQHRFLDQGRAGWWNDSETLKSSYFTDGVMDPRTEPVRLDGTGKPLGIPAYAHIGVGMMGKTPVAPSGTGFPVNVMDKEVAADSVALYYKKTRIIDFTPLLKLI